MIETGSLHAGRLILPPEQFYWAVVDSSAVGVCNGRLRTRLGYLFENVLPEPIEQVQTSYLRVNRTASAPFLACGMGFARLQQIIQEHPGATQLGPSAVPEFVTEQLGVMRIPIERLNLLREEFEPPEVRRVKRRWVFQFIAIVWSASAVLAMGFERRTSAMTRQARALTEKRFQLINQTVGAGEANGQSPDIRLIAELRRMQQSRGSQAGKVLDPRSLDCAPILAGLLQHWPSNVTMMTDSIVITPTSIAIRGTTPGSQDVQAVTNSLNEFTTKTSQKTSEGGAGGAGWTLQQPQMTSGRDGVQAVFQLVRPERRGTS